MGRVLPITDVKAISTCLEMIVGVVVLEKKYIYIYIG